MIYLLLSIAFSSSLLIFFKLFEKYQVNAVLAIAVNYGVAAIVGSFFIQGSIELNSSDTIWILISMILGFLFSAVFNLSRMATQRVGLGLTSVAMKLGVVFPVILGILFYREPFHWINYLGLISGFTSIYFLNKPNKTNDNQFNRFLLILPVLVWLGSGLCDSAVQLIQKKFPIPASNGMFSFTTFLAAAISSIGFIVFKRVRWDSRSVIGGIGLGVPNFFSIHFLVLALNSMKSTYQIDSSQLFMINNLAIVVVSIGIGLFLFKEKINTYKQIGLVLALVSLYLINYKQ